jgi:hypothetical protein
MREFYFRAPAGPQPAAAKMHIGEFQMVSLAGRPFVSVDFTDAVIDGSLIIGPAWLARFLQVLEAHLAG